MTNKPPRALTVSESPVLTEQQVLHILQKTPAKHVYTRPGRGGQQFTYVTGTYVKKVLNYAFGWDWDFEIIDKGREGAQVWVQGRLTARMGERKIVKEQFGRAEIKMMKGTQNAVDYGNDLKAAATDALKKCASELGVASDIYGKDEFNEINTEAVVLTPQDVADSKEVKRVRDHIKASTDIATLEACKDALTTNELRELYELKHELLEQPA